MHIKNRDIPELKKTKKRLRGRKGVENTIRHMYLQTSSIISQKIKLAFNRKWLSAIMWNHGWKICFLCEQVLYKKCAGEDFLTIF